MTRKLSWIGEKSNDYVLYIIEDTIRSLEEKVKELEAKNAALEKKLDGVSRLFSREQIELLSGTMDS